MKTESLTITTKDQFALQALVVNVDHPKATIQFNSATGVRKEYYLKFATYLAGQQYRVVLFDYRGIGESRPKKLRGFDAHMHEWGTKDMTAVTNYIIKEYPAEPIIAIGHSIGGQLFGAIEHHSIFSKVVMLNCSSGYWKQLASPYKYFAWLAWNLILPTTAPILGYLPAKFFKQGENLPTGVAREWAGWCMQESYFESFIKAHYAQNCFYHFKTPIISVYPTDDHIANDRSVNALLNFYPEAEKKIVRINPADHQLKRIGHFGFFGRSIRDKMWPFLLQLIET